MDDSAEFSFRSGGLQVTLTCTQMDGHRRRIRRAEVLCVGKKVIPCGPCESWKLASEEKHWDFYHPGREDLSPQRVASIPLHEVSWIMGTGPLSREVESYDFGSVRGWKIITRSVQCQRCGSPYEPERLPSPLRRPLPLLDAADPKWLNYACSKCWQELEEIFRGKNTRPFSQASRELNEQLRFDRRLRLFKEDRSANVRWLREFVSEGSFTNAEFRALCDYYGNVCLRCGERRPLVGDHVIPVVSGGRGDISNIQPLCGACNGIKGTATTDYRPAWSSGVGARS